MDEQKTQVNVEQTDREPPVEEIQPWEQPKLERLHVSLDTANSKGSNSDGTRSTKFPPP